MNERVGKVPGLGDWVESDPVLRVGRCPDILEILAGKRKRFRQEMGRAGSEKQEQGPGWPSQYDPPGNLVLSPS